VCHGNIVGIGVPQIPGGKILAKWVRECISFEKGLLFIGTFIGMVWVQRPSRFTFFGDSWDVLYAFLLDPRTILQPHNEHFIPLFKLLYFAEYKIFGAHHLGYMLVLYLLHCVVVVLVYSLGRQIGLSLWSSMTAALIFAFSSVPWEVTGWSFEQDFALGVLFVFANLSVFLRGAPEQDTLLRFAILSLIGYWAGGPICLVLPLTLTGYWVVRRLLAEDVNLRSLGYVLSALWVPAAIYYLSVRLAVRLTSHLPHHPIAYPKMHLHLRDLPAMVDFSLFGTAWGLVLPTLTFIHSQAVVSASFLLILLAILAVVCYRGLTSSQQIYFWLLASITIGAYLVISLGRLQYGVALGASSRYQYLSSASFALLLVLCWQGLRRTIVADRTPLWWHALGLLVVFYILAFHIKTTRVENLDAERGKKAQEFLTGAKKASYPEHMPEGTTVLGAAFQVPPALIPPRRPLWMILQVLEGNRHTVVPVENYLEHAQTLDTFNIVRDGGFEKQVENRDWRSFEGAEFSQNSQAAHRGEYGMSISLPKHGSAFSDNVIRTCSSELAEKVFTYAISVRTVSANALVARMLFKASDGTILSIYSSEPAPGDGQWHQLITGGLSPRGTCSVGIDVEDDGITRVSAMVDDALLVLHPGLVNARNEPIFTLPSVITSWH